MKYLAVFIIFLSILIPSCVLAFFFCRVFLFEQGEIRALPRVVPSHITRHEARTTLENGGVGPMVEVR